MPTKITINNMLSIVTHKYKLPERQIIDIRQESPKEVLEFFIKKELPILQYKNINHGSGLTGKHKNTIFMSTITIKETELPPGVLQADTIQNINIDYLTPHKKFYDKNFFTKLVKSNLISYLSSPITQKYGGLKKLYNGLENDDGKISALVEIGQIIIKKSFERKNLADYIPEDLPQTIKVERLQNKPRKTSNTYLKK